MVLGLILGIQPTALALLVAGDVDSSGAVNAVDVQTVTNGALGLSVAGQADIDSSGGTNAVDVQLCINAALGISIDADGDGLCDAAEENLGTDPHKADTDADNLSDGWEMANGRNPLVKDPDKLARVLFFRPDESDLYIMNLDGSGVQNVTNSPEREYSARFSPDGTKILYMQFSKQVWPLPVGSYWAGDVWVMKSDGQNKINLTHSSMSSEDSAIWSPDGATIYYTKFDAGTLVLDIWAMDSEGTNKRKLIPSQSFSGASALSPDGNKLIIGGLILDVHTLGTTTSNAGFNPAGWLKDSVHVYGTGLAVYVPGAAGEVCIGTPGFDSEVQLTNDGQDFKSRFELSTDGTRIAYTAGSQIVDSMTDNRLYVVDVNTPGSSLLSQAHFVGASKWIPDGSGFVFSAERRLYADIYAEDIYWHKFATGEEMNITNTDAREGLLDIYEPTG
ncbi:MAG: PD40 domain-containing protein [Candidatus Hydrogenedentes bacterium]|nr:PD40 domain-containing protein [Candidatus Hydrogenedentota bacterium]